MLADSCFAEVEKNVYLAHLPFVKPPELQWRKEDCVPKSFIKLDTSPFDGKGRFDVPAGSQEDTAQHYRCVKGLAGQAREKSTNHQEYAKG